jgi:hypothetical protein
MEIADAQTVQDAAFIALSREAMPALIAEVRRLRAERDALKAELAKVPTLGGALFIPCNSLEVQP